jgi:predicted DNA-binding protein with PD1-like motif
MMISLRMRRTSEAKKVLATIAQGNGVKFRHITCIYASKMMISLCMRRASEAKHVLATIAQGNGVKLSLITNLKTVQTGK